MARMDILVNESAMAALADIGDGAFESGEDVHGALIGSCGDPFRILSAEVSADSPVQGAVGWFFAFGSGSPPSDEEAARLSAGFAGKHFAALIDPSASSISFFVIEGRKARPARSAVLEGA